MKQEEEQVWGLVNMLRFLFGILLLFCLVVNGSSQEFILEFASEDGSVVTYPYRVEFTDGTISDDGEEVTSIDIEGGAQTATGWTDGDTDVYLTTTSDNVGIGTTVSSHKLEITDTNTVNNRAGLYITQSGENDGTGYGSYVTKTGAANTNIGGYFSASGGGANYGLIVENGDIGLGTASPDTRLDLSGTLSYTPLATQVIDAATDTILANAALVVLNPDADYTLTSTPIIVDGAIGQILYITCANAEANYVALVDEDTSAGSNIELGAATRRVSGKDMLILMFNGSQWQEIGWTDL